MAEYVCAGCGDKFKTRRSRLKPTGNWCSPCAVRKAMKVRVYGPASEESRRKMSESHRGKPGYWTGRKFSPEHCRNLSRSRKGKPSITKGRRRIPETMRRMRESVHDCCSGMVRRILKIKKEAKVYRTSDYLGYTRSDFVEHIESKFQTGMSWDNYGEWHIDHIVPVAHFVRIGVTDVRVINALSNLQPLWKLDNLRKSDKLTA